MAHPQQVAAGHLYPYSKQDVTADENLCCADHRRIDISTTQDLVLCWQKSPQTPELSIEMRLRQVEVFEQGDFLTKFFKQTCHDTKKKAFCSILCHVSERVFKRVCKTRREICVAAEQASVQPCPRTGRNYLWKSANPVFSLDLRPKKSPSAF